VMSYEALADGIGPEVVVERVLAATAQPIVTSSQYSSQYAGQPA
jgi:hypothetical protein